jgi:hypothetical protein
MAHDTDAREVAAKIVKKKIETIHLSSIAQKTMFGVLIKFATSSP